MDTFTVSFFGNRRIEDPFAVEERLEGEVRRLLNSGKFIEFLVGRSGEFDLLAAAVVRRCRERVREDNSLLVLVLPYETAEYRKNRSAFENYYGEIEICEDSAGEHYKRAYRIRNDAVLARSDLALFYAGYEEGNTGKMLAQAKKAGIPFLNLAPPHPQT